MCYIAARKRDYTSWMVTLYPALIKFRAILDPMFPSPMNPSLCNKSRKWKLSTNSTRPKKNVHKKKTSHSLGDICLLNYCTLNLEFWMLNGSSDFILLCFYLNRTLDRHCWFHSSDYEAECIIWKISSYWFNNIHQRTKRHWMVGRAQLAPLGPGLRHLRQGFLEHKKLWIVIMHIETIQSHLILASQK